MHKTAVAIKTNSVLDFVFKAQWWYLIFTNENIQLTTWCPTNLAWNWTYPKYVCQQSQGSATIILRCNETERN